MVGAVLGEISQLATSTPFEFPELMGASTALPAFQTRAEQLVPTVRMLERHRIASTSRSGRW